MKMSKQDFKVFHVENRSLLLSQDLHSLQANLKIRIKPTDKWIGSEVFQPLQLTVIKIMRNRVMTLSVSGELAKLAEWEGKVIKKQTPPSPPKNAKQTNNSSPT